VSEKVMVDGTETLRVPAPIVAVATVEAEAPLASRHVPSVNMIAIPTVATTAREKLRRRLFA
jgi:hypothetical protein